MAADDLGVAQGTVDSVVPFRPRRYLDRLDLDGLRGREPEMHTAPGTRGKVLDAAIDLFAFKGYNACSMRDIAKVVNIGAPAIYNYYASKSDILIASLDFVLSTFYAAVLKSPIPRSPESALFCILRRHVLFGIMNRTFARAADALLNKDLMRRELPENCRFRYSLAMEEYRKILEELIRDVVGEDSSIDFALQAFLVHEIVDRAGEWYEPASPLNPADIADQCCEAVARLLELPAKKA